MAKKKTSKTISGGCNKRSYSKRSTAEDHCEELQRKEDDMTIHVYTCRRCGKFHVGHGNTN